MPYIDQVDRIDYNEPVEELASLLTTNTDGKPVAGEVNYVISKLVWDLFDANPSYTLGNNLVGVLECVKQEFYRRKLAPYEDAKIEENGDL